MRLQYRGWSAVLVRVLVGAFLAVVVIVWRPSSAMATGIPGTFVPLDPARVLDTRVAIGSPGPIAPDSTAYVQIAGRGGVPTAGVSAVVLNLTETGATSGGYLTVYPDGTTRPTASNLNYPAGDTRANLVTVRLGSNGKIAIASSNRSPVQLVADVSGYFVAGTPAAAGAFTSLNPTRILDTRSGVGATGPVAANSTIHVQVAGRGGVPAGGVSAVVLNVTETDAQAAGYVTVYPDDAPLPTASNLNYPKGDTRANLVTVKLGTNGRIALASSNPSTVQMVADVAGYYLSGTPTAAGAFVPVDPSRVLDTRSANGALGPVAANSTVELQIAGRGGVPSTGVSAVVLNVTETDAHQGGYLTVYPDGTTRPTASNLNYPKGDTRANLVTVRLGSTGGIDIASSNTSTVQLVADVAGYYLTGIPPVTCSDPMTMTFDTTRDIRLNNHVAFTLQGSGPVTVRWGGTGTATPKPSGVGSEQTYPADPGTIGYTYSAAGVYTVTVCGQVSHFSSQGQSTLVSVSSFGDLGTTDYSGAFSGAMELISVPTTLPASVTTVSHMFSGASKFNQDLSGWDTSNITDMSGMFQNAGEFDQNVGSWNTAKVTDMSSMFDHATVFNQDIGGWDTSSVTDMSYMFSWSAFDQPIGGWRTGQVTDMSHMFYVDETFNQPVGSWDISHVTDLSGMFETANAFDQPIGTWNTGSVTRMDQMFLDAYNFNQEIGGWDTSSVTTTHQMFYLASSFNQPIGHWDTSKVTDMGSMFYQDTSFNQPIGNWNVAAVSDMSSMFQGATAFDQPIDGWDTGRVTTMSQMFRGARAFDQPLASWNTAQVTTMSGMFSYASAFNQPIGSWDTSRVTTMSAMFSSAYAFDQPIGGWNTSQVTAMSDMFSSAYAFDQPIGEWDTSRVTTMSSMFMLSGFDENIGGWNVGSVKWMGSMFQNATLSTTNYDALLSGWANQTVQHNVVFSAGFSHYSIAASDSRNTLVSVDGWSISDAGPA